MKTIKLGFVTNLAGVIFPAKTGYTFTNQVGGTSCSHPLLEGVFVPLTLTNFYFDALEDVRLVLGDKYVGQKVSEQLKQMNLQDVLAPLSDDEYRAFVAEHHINGLLAEAWVPVRVLAQESKYSPLDDFEGRVGVLVYENSD